MPEAPITGHHSNTKMHQRIADGQISGNFLEMSARVVDYHFSLYHPSSSSIFDNFILRLPNELNNRGYYWIYDINGGVVSKIS